MGKDLDGKYFPFLTNETMSLTYLPMEEDGRISALRHFDVRYPFTNLNPEVVLDYEFPISENEFAAIYDRVFVWKAPEFDKPTEAKKPTYEKALQDVFDEVITMLKAKHKDYGTDNLKRHGERGIIIRCDDKLARLSHLIDTPAAVNESGEDSWMDLIGYGVQAIMLRRGWIDYPTS
ncbi:MAG: hypothetical protein KQI81_08925 [Deltaproteobacteria bacterium]|nr:hypothetical protein [Deltaproteobacteria bacterium]